MSTIEMYSIEPVFMTNNICWNIGIFIFLNKLIVLVITKQRLLTFWRSSYTTYSIFSISLFILWTIFLVFFKIMFSYSSVKYMYIWYTHMGIIKCDDTDMMSSAVFRSVVRPLSADTVTERGHESRKKGQWLEWTYGHICFHSITDTNPEHLSWPHILYIQSGAVKTL